MEGKVLGREAHTTLEKRSRKGLSGLVGGGMLAKMQRRSQLGKEHGMKVLGAKAGKLLAMSYIQEPVRRAEWPKCIHHED